MRHLILVALCCYATSALACQRMLSPPIAPRDLDRVAAAEIAASDAIVDAVVGPWSRDGLILDVLRVWKGAPRRRIAVTPDNCGPSSPRRGASVRVLLTLDRARGEWSARDPSLGGRVDDYRRLDRLVDRRLGSIRPAHFATIASMPPP